MATTRTAKATPKAEAKTVTKKITVSALIKIAKGLDKASTSMWETTGLMIFQRIEEFNDRKGDKDSMMETFTAILQDEHGKNDVPKHGMNRAGKVIELRHDDELKSVKWSSWKVTSRLCQNTSDIFKGLEADVDMWDEEGSIISRRKLLDALALLVEEPEEPEGEGEGSGEGEKEPEEAITTIQRSVTLIDQKFDELDDSDLELALLLLEKLVEDLEKRIG